MADDCRVTCASRRTFITHMSGAMLAALVGVEAVAQAADGATIDKQTGVILVRLQGKVIAFNLACPHENTALRWKQAVGRFECTKHDSKYSPDGTYIGGRATRNMDRLKIERDGANVVVDLSNLIKSDTQAAEWKAAVIAV